MPAIVRERFPAHVSSGASLLEDVRLTAGTSIGSFTSSRRRMHNGAQRSKNLMPWTADPSAIARSSALDPADPLAREAAAVAEVFEIVTARLASADEMARLNDIRRRSPLAPWKLLLRAVDAFHRNDDERVAANVVAIDARSPVARAGAILSELTTGRGNGERSFTAQRLIDRISAGGPPSPRNSGASRPQRTAMTEGDCAKKPAPSRARSTSSLHTPASRRGWSCCLSAESTSVPNRSLRCSDWTRTIWQSDASGHAC